MRTNFTLALALTAGFLGGLASRYWSPTPAYAQAPSAPPAEARAQKFVLVDENGIARGVFGFESNGSPVIEISNGNNGHVFKTRWYYEGPGLVVHDYPSFPHKTTLLP